MTGVEAVKIDPTIGFYIRTTMQATISIRVGQKSYRIQALEVMYVEKEHTRKRMTKRDSSTKLETGVKN